MNDSVPVQIPAQDLDVEGFIVSAEERQAIIALLNSSPGPNVLEKTKAFPDGSPLEGRKPTFSAIKDANGTILLLHDKAVLGKGAFGNVVVAQVIQSSDARMAVGDYYAVKVQQPRNAKLAKKIEKEDEIGRDLGLNMSGFAAGRLYYSIMPVLQGEPLSKAVPSYVGKFKKDEKPQTPFDKPEDFNVPYFISLFQRMTDAVNVVHQNGIIHLDIKPDNMMMDPKTGEIKLIDFGTSKRRNEELPEPSRETIGTPAYMASDYFNEECIQPLSTKQDIYSLARTFELVMYGNMLKMNAQSYDERAPMPSLNEFELYVSSHLKNQMLPNDNHSPDIEAINELTDLIQVMRNQDPSVRPEATEIRARLNAISDKYQHAPKMAGPSTDTNPLIEAENFVQSIMKDLKGFRNAQSKEHMKRITPMLQQHGKSEQLAQVRQLLYDLDQVKIALKEHRYFDADAAYRNVGAIVKAHADANGDYVAKLCDKVQNDILNRAAPSERSKLHVS